MVQVFLSYTNTFQTDLFDSKQVLQFWIKVDLGVMAMQISVIHRIPLFLRGKGLTSLQRIQLACLKLYRQDGLLDEDTTENCIVYNIVYSCSWEYKNETGYLL